MPVHAAQYDGETAGRAALSGASGRNPRGADCAGAAAARAHAGCKVKPAPLVDRFGRLHDNLRISVTDRCNIRCFYCMPEEGVRFMERQDILSYEEIERFARVASNLGVTKLRITGGEPLVRRDVPRLIEKVAA